METFTGRVVRRFSIYSNFYFIEIRIPGENDQTKSSFPVLIKLEELENGSYDHARVGDVVSVTGQMETSQGHYTNTCFCAKKISLIEKWDTDKYGIFQYIPPWNSAAAHSRTVPILHRDLVAAVQCQVDVVDRVVEYLREKFTNFHIEQSLSPLSICQDRIVGIWVDRSETRPNFHIQEILDDRILTYTLSRVYSFTNPNNVSTTLDSLTETICEQLRVLGEEDRNISIRVHAFPKQIPIESIAQKIVSKIPVKFDPRNFSHTLSIVFVNGLWYSSVARADAGGAVGSHLYKGGSSQSLEISKASQKLFEAFSRIDRIWGEKNLTDLSGKIAIDIGASPGGWSYCMALEKRAQRVIAVDNGLFSPPTPPAVEHWKMRGEEAVEKLLKNHENFNSISCYTCDMNVDCMITVDLFISAIPLMEKGSFAVLTFKRTIKNKEKWELRKSEGIEKLKCRFGDVVEIHLIANTPNETTVLVRIDQ